MLLRLATASIVLLAVWRPQGLALAMCFATLVALPARGGHLLEPRSLAVGAAVGLLSSPIPYSFELEALGRLGDGP